MTPLDRNRDPLQPFTWDEIQGMTQAELYESWLERQRALRSAGREYTKRLINPATGKVVAELE